MKYYILYIYKSALEAIISNFFHSLMIAPRPLLWVIISVLVLSTESVSDLSPRRWKSIAYHFDIDALSNGRFNGIPFHQQSKRSTY